MLEDKKAGPGGPAGERGSGTKTFRGLEILYKGLLVLSAVLANDLQEIITAFQMRDGNGLLVNTGRKLLLLCEDQYT